MKERIRYIDAIKGAAILFVVYYHILLRVPYRESVSVTVFEALCMQMFFFLSGKFAKRITHPTTSNIERLKNCVDKVQYILLPTILCFIIAVLYRNADFSYWIMQEQKLGYWFTYTLFFLFVLHATLCALLKALHLSRIQWIILPAIGSILYLFQYKIYLHDSYQILQILSFRSVMRYYAFFALGAVLPAIPVQLINIIRNKYIFLLALICAFYTGDYEFIDAHGAGWYLKQCMYLLRSFGLVYVIYLLFKNSSWINADNKGSRLLQFLGRKSIIIYFLHFYFLFRIPYLRELIDQALSTVGSFGGQSTFIIEFAFCLPVACLITLACVVLGSMLCQSALVSRFLFGQKQR